MTPEKFGSKHAQSERQYVYIHLSIFIFAHAVCIFIFGLVPRSELPSGSYLAHIMDWVLRKDISFYKNELVNSISAIWITVLFVHVIWGFSYTLFPRKEKVSKIKEDAIVSEKVSNHDSPSTKKQKKEISEGMAWIFLIIAGLIEIYWATGLKTNSMGILTLLAIFLSFDLLIRATKKVPIGTAYAIFTGIGTIGTILVDMFYFQEPFKLIKILLILLLAGFIIGLKFSDGTVKKGDA
ncbi:DMT family transporter [Paenibacillus sp. FA6]|uniref:DMT family transporter n=1 Tax=Paenibacillus sp. FA6 TaxID=3413029 RepID=UPI003F65E98D